MLNDVTPHSPLQDGLNATLSIPYPQYQIQCARCKNNAPGNLVIRYGDNQTGRVNDLIHEALLQWRSTMEHVMKEMIENIRWGDGKQ